MATEAKDIKKATEMEEVTKEEGEVETETKNDETKDSEKPEVNGTITPEIRNKILKQVEYYFGNYNLPRDKFLTDQTKSDDGWVSMETMVKFKRLADLSTDHKVIRNALKSSELIEVDDKKDRIRRSPENPLPYFGEDLMAETVKRTVYCKGLPRDGSINLDLLLEYFKPYGPYETIHMRQFFDKATKKHGFKGSILIVFPDEEKANSFMDIDDVKYRNMPLLRKWHQNYLEQKAEEISERKARKEARLEMLSKEGGPASNTPELNEIDPIPRGTFLFATGFTNTTTREDIKAVLQDYEQVQVAFLDFAKGDTEGYIRLVKEFSNADLMKALDGKFKVNDAEVTVRMVEGTEEDEQVKKAEMARTKVFSQSNRKRKFRGKGRAGGGSSFKRRKY